MTFFHNTFFRYALKSWVLRGLSRASTDAGTWLADIYGSKVEGVRHRVLLVET